jgi:hypothetical protein
MVLKNGEINMGPMTIKKVSVEAINIALAISITLKNVFRAQVTTEPFTGGPEYTTPLYPVSNVQGGIGVQKK